MIPKYCDLPFHLTYNFKQLSDNETVKSSQIQPNDIINISLVNPHVQQYIEEPISADEDKVVKLIQMGFDREQAKAALLETCNDFEQSIERLLASQPNPPQSNQEPNQEHLNTLMTMGFTQQQAQEALQKANGDVHIAANILLS